MRPRVNARSVWLPAPSAPLALSASQGCSSPSASPCVGAGMLPWRIVRQHWRVCPHQHPRERALMYGGECAHGHVRVCCRGVRWAMQSVPVRCDQQSASIRDALVIVDLCSVCLPAAIPGLACSHHGACHTWKVSARVEARGLWTSLDILSMGDATGSCAFPQRRCPSCPKVDPLATFENFENSDLWC